MKEQPKHIFSTATNRRSDLLLLLLYVVVTAVILFRVMVDNYLSPDSEAYLGLAQNLLDGHGLYMFHGQESSRRFFSTWPVGYPFLIYLLAVLTGLSVFWASKAVNLLFLLLGFLLLRHFSRQYAYVLASVYGSYTLLEIYSFTWSEAPFVFGLLCLAFLVNKHLRGDDSADNIFLIFTTCLFLFLIRYIGAFALSVPALLAAYAVYKPNQRAAIQLTVAVAVLVLLIGLYLGMNYYLSGRITGIDRLYGETETAGAFTVMLLRGLLNELLIIRKHFFKGPPDTLFFITTGLQLIVIILIGYLLRKEKNYLPAFRQNTLSLTCFSIALLYLLAVITLRLISHFDPLDYRLLSPFSFLFLIGITNYIAALSSQPSFNKVRWLTFGFFLVSLLLNLPKEYLLRKLTEII